MNLNTIKDMLNEALPVIETFAPTVARAIGGPVGIAASYIIPILGRSYGLNSSHWDALSGAISSDPDAQTKLQKIENEHGTILNDLMNVVHNLQSSEINIKMNWK